MKVADLTSTQQRLVDAMKNTGRRLVRLRGGYWVLEGMAVDHHGYPVGESWSYVTVWALIEKGVLKSVGLCTTEKERQQSPWVLV